MTALVVGDLDITGNAALGTVDTFRVAEGATLTLSAGQAGAAELEGRHVVQDAAAAFFDGAAPRPFLAGAAGVTVTDMASRRSWPRCAGPSRASWPMTASRATAPRCWPTWRARTAAAPS
ncbi:hypothetical protein [Teichococcus aestuarii]|uniref:hypothetical protein n=1 Tax=Teichococcus aestuarii TaxID=568898 RepID=UPI003609D1CC